MSESEFDRFIEQYHQANHEFAAGNCRPLQQLFSHGDDVTLLDPSGGRLRGWEEVSQRQERNASLFVEGEPMVFERVASGVTPDLAFIVEVERFRSRMSANQEIRSGALRVTTIFRPEDGAWKVVHRHADPITAPPPPESIAQQ